jgi:hypothetical protein
MAPITSTARDGTCAANTIPARRGIRIAPAKTPVKAATVEREGATKLHALGKADASVHTVQVFMRQQVS